MTVDLLIISFSNPCLRVFYMLKISKLERKQNKLEINESALNSKRVIDFKLTAKLMGLR